MLAAVGARAWRFTLERAKREQEAAWAAKYPEHTKLAKVREKSQVCGEFLEWLLQSKTVAISNGEEALEDNGDENPDYEERECRVGLGVYDPWVSGYLQPCYVTTEALLAEFFGIDRDALEDEKRAMLDEIRDAQRASA